MIRTWCLAIIISVVAGIGTGHAEIIGIFSDSRGCPCEVTDRAGDVLLTIAVLHVDSPGARGSRFSATKPACLEVTYLYETAFFFALGNSQTGISFDYGQCLTGTYQLLTITFFAYGLTPDCCYFEVLPDPFAPSGEIEVIDCDNQVSFVSGLFDIVNSTEICQCAPGPVECHPVPAETSTWGKIKTLYQ